MPNETYDLMLVVSAEADTARRTAIASDAEALITKGGGTVSERTEWGERPLAFDIEHEATGDYRIIRFEAPGSALEAISRQLNITDQLLRHRIIKAVPGAPATVAASPDSPAPAFATPAATEAPAAPATPEAEPAAPAAEEAPSSGTESPETPAAE